MGFRHWLIESGERFRTESPSFAAKRSGQKLMEGILRKIPRPNGESIWERDWDVLIILDACRYDTFEAEYGDAEWLNSLQPTQSVASASPGWMDKTFSPKYQDEMANTAYVTGNPFSQNHVPKNSLALVDDVWRYVWDEEVGTIPPEPLTNQAVKHYRTGKYDRIIIHYMQPHWPYINNPIDKGFQPDTILSDSKETNAFDLQNKGMISKQKHLDSYTGNLTYLVDHIKNVLINSIDAEKVILTSDHGEAFGEFGVYEHPEGVPLPVLRTVPWALTSATDRGKYQVEKIKKQKDINTSRIEQLQDLGYV